MAIWPFNRKKKEETEAVPAEVQEYYQAEKRERIGVAWVLALVTLAITVAVVLGLFFGGRAVYRQAHKDKDNTSQTKPEENPTPATQNQPAGTPPSSSSSQASNQPATPSPSTPATPSQAPSSGTTSTTTLTNTGPADLLPAFVIASVAGFGLNELRLRKKLN